MKSPWRVGGELVDPEVPLHLRKQLAELLGDQIDRLTELIDELTGGEVTTSGEGPFVIHGGVPVSSLPAAELHRNLTGADLHWPRPHAATHIVGGSDALPVPGVPQPVGAAGVVGIGPAYSREDHVHAGSAYRWMDEVPAGVIPAANYTLTAAPNPMNSLMLYRNGVYQLLNTHYTLVGATITFALAYAPVLGDWLFCHYRY